MRLNPDSGTMTIGSIDYPVKAVKVKNLTITVVMLDGDERELIGAQTERMVAVRAALLTVESGWYISLEWGDMDDCCVPERNWDDPYAEEPTDVQVALYAQGMERVTDEEGENAVFPHMPAADVISLINEMSTLPTAARVTIEHQGTEIGADGKRRECHALNIYTDEEPDEPA